MASKTKRVALYLRVSTDEQTTSNQRLALMEVGDRRGWNIVKVYEDAGISGAKGRDKRPGFNATMKDALRRHFDVLAVWSIDRLGRSTATVATALAELDAAGVAIYSDREGMDATTPHGRAMLQMAAVFAELEHDNPGTGQCGLDAGTRSRQAPRSAAREHQRRNCHQAAPGRWNGHGEDRARAGCRRQHGPAARSRMTAPAA